MDVYKQIEAIVYYHKKMRWSTLNIVYVESALHDDKRRGDHLSCKGNSNHSL